MRNFLAMLLLFFCGLAASEQTCESLTFQKTDFPVTLKDSKSFNLRLASMLRLRVPLGFNEIDVHNTGASLFYPNQGSIHVSVIEEKLEIDKDVGTWIGPRYQRVLDGKLGCEAMREHVWGEINYMKRFEKDWKTLYAFGNNNYHTIYIIDQEFPHYVINVTVDGGDVKRFEYVLGTIRQIK